MSYHKLAKVEPEKLELYKEQFAITHPNITRTELIATVAFDKSSSTFGCDQYYVCLFAKAVTTSPRLLFRGSQALFPEEAVYKLLQLQAEDIGTMVNQAAGKGQMTKEQWRLPSDHTGMLTVCESRHNVPVGWDEGRWSNTLPSTSGTSSTKHAGKQDVPPAYKK